MGASYQINQNFNQNEQNIQVGHVEKLIIIVILYNMQTWLTFVIISNPCMQAKVPSGINLANNAQAMMEILKAFMKQF